MYFHLHVFQCFSICASQNPDMTFYRVKDYVLLIATAPKLHPNTCNEKKNAKGLLKYNRINTI